MKDDKFYDFSKSLLIALGLNDATVGVAKLAVNDRSPNGKRFGFPSGHTSSSFAFASVVHDYYGPWVAAPFYGIGVFTGWGRLWDREHRFTDVWYGELIGTVIGHSVGLRHSMHLMEMQVTPLVEPAESRNGGTNFGVMLSRSFEAAAAAAAIPAFCARPRCGMMPSAGDQTADVGARR